MKRAHPSNDIDAKRRIIIKTVCYIICHHYYNNISYIHRLKVQVTANQIGKMMEPR